MDAVTIQPTCRLCGADLTRRDPVIDLGELKVSAFPPPGEPYVVAPLALAECPSCKLVQLTHTVAPEHRYTGEYWYASGINGTMREELRNVVREARMWARVEDGDWVLDIGANDGTLLSAWREHLWEGRPYRFAVEPSPTFSKQLADVAESVLTEAFPSPALEGARPFKVITSIAMFYGVDDPVGFAQAVKRLLAPDGVWIVQMQDLHNMVRNTAFDNICHEHLTYYTVETFAEVCRRAGLQLVSVAPREINGGSLRFIVRHAGDAILDLPIVTPPVDWAAFQDRIDERVLKLVQTVATARDYGNVVDLLGASTKGNTLLQVAGLGPSHIRACWERHPKKIGRTTVTGIPIVLERLPAALRADDWPNLLICPIWQFREALIERYANYLQAGGKIYFPLPEGDLFQYLPRELQ